MKKTKKILAALLAAATLLAISLPGFAADPADETQSMPAYDPTPAYTSVTGILKSIEPFYENDQPVEGRYFVILEKGDETIWLSVDEQSFVTGGEIKDLKPGDRVTGFYDSSLPVIMIYPARYRAVALVIGLGAAEAVEFDIFDDTLTDQDKNLKLNIGENTQILTQAGEPYEGGLENRTLVVFYGFVTASIPGQTSPTKIIVMDMDDIQPIEEGEGDIFDDLSRMPILVEGKILEGASAVMENGVIMVPLRAISEALDFEVIWEAETRTVFLGNLVSCVIGSDAYNYARVAPISLGQAPIIIGGSTYVPLRFFTEVAKQSNAYMFEGQIVIDNGEVMN